MKQRKIGICIVVLLVCSFIGAFFTWKTECKEHPVFSYYLLLSADDSVETSILDFERGGSGRTYRGKSVLQAYFSEADASSVADRLKSNGKETLIEKVSCSVPCSKKDREELHCKLNSLNGVAHVLYLLANGLEQGEITQRQAKNTVQSVCLVLNGCKGGRGAWGEKITNCVLETEEILDTDVYQANKLRNAMVGICLTFVR